MKTIERFPTCAGDLGWFALSRYKDHPFTPRQQLQKTYDYVVIGGGFAGINAAHRLAELNPGATIAVFEALKIGMGDSGRNAGFLMDVPHSFGEPGMTIADHQYRMKLNRIVIARMDAIRVANNLTCDWRQSGKYLAAREPRFLKNLYAMADIIDRIGEESRLIDKATLAEKLGINYYIKALYTAGTCLINPSETVRGLASVLPGNVDIFEETPIVQIDDRKVVEVTLADGIRIKAGKLLLLAGVFIDRFGIEKAGRMTPAGSFGAFTRTLKEEEMAQFAKIVPWGCTSAHAAGTTVRLLTDKRVYVRNGLTFPTHLSLSNSQVDHARKQLRLSFENRFPTLRHVEFEYVYGGMIPLTINGQSFFFQKSPNVYAAAVGDGCGLTRSSMLGLYLAELASGIDGEEVRHLLKTSNPGWCPPEPIKTFAANIRMKLEEYQARGEV
ncbi:NAD(P)/FAD-dependent oxidoreductase [Bartonella sp. LJL80]